MANRCDDSHLRISRIFCSFQRVRIRREWHQQDCVGDRQVVLFSTRAFAIAVFHQTGEAFWSTPRCDQPCREELSTGTLSLCSLLTARAGELLIYSQSNLAVAFHGFYCAHIQSPLSVSGYRSLLALDPAHAVAADQPPLFRIAFPSQSSVTGLSTTQILGVTVFSLLTREWYIANAIVDHKEVNWLHA